MEGGGHAGKARGAPAQCRAALRDGMESREEAKQEKGRRQMREAEDGMAGSRRVPARGAGAGEWGGSGVAEGSAQDLPVCPPRAPPAAR